MAVVARVFFDTSVLLPGLIDTGGGSGAPRRIMVAIADGTVGGVCTAWHCCLEFFAVATQLPGDLRVARCDALCLLESQILPRFHVYELPEDARAAFLRSIEIEQVTGGRIYDAHIAEIARSTGARTVVTGNRRHFASLLRYQVEVVTAEEYASRL